MEMVTLVIGITLGVVFKSWIMQFVRKLVMLVREAIDWTADDDETEE
jgi:hypothetical protein